MINFIHNKKQVVHPVIQILPDAGPVLAAPSPLADVAMSPPVLLSMKVAVPPASLCLCWLSVVLSRQFAAVLLMMKRLIQDVFCMNEEPVN